MTDLARPFRHLCPDADRLDAMTDEEFWAHVAESLAGPMFVEAAELLDDMPVTSINAEPCPECGEVGPCGYDSEGRALIHALTDEDT